MRDLECPQIALGLVVVERNRQVIEEGEHLVLVAQEAFEQVAGWGLGEPTALARPALLVGWWIGGQPGGQQRPVAGEEGLALGGGQAALALRAGLLGCRPHRP